MRHLRYTLICFPVCLASVCRLRPSDNILSTTVNSARTSVLPEISSRISGTANSTDARYSTLATSIANNATTFVPETPTTSTTLGFNSSSVNVQETSAAETTSTASTTTTFANTTSPTPSSSTSAIPSTTITTTNGTTSSSTASSNSTSSTTSSTAASSTSSSSTTLSSNGTSSTTTSSTTPISTAYWDDSLKDAISRYHAMVRASYGLAPVRWNDDAANYAKNYLDSSNCQYGYSTNNPYKENISLGRPLQNAMERWWFNQPQSNAIMRSPFLNSFGCAIRDCANSLYVVCEYELVPGVEAVPG